MNLYGTIQNGGFGTNAPMQYGAGFNPYYGGMAPPPRYQTMGNMVPLGGGVNVYNTVQPQQQQYNNGMVFQPIPQQYYQQPQYQSPFGGDYNNPYATTFAAYRQQQQIGYPQQFSGNFGYPGGGMYGGYNPNFYVSPMYRQQQIQQLKSMDKLKYEIAAGFKGKSIDMEKLDQALEARYNPSSQYEKMSEEERSNLSNWNTLVQMSQMANNPYLETGGRSIARMMIEQSANYHRELDNHSLFEFLQNDLWKLQREYWIAQNISRGYNRNLSSTYDSKEYNELLKLHNSANPYIDQILNDSRYDNNLYDEELGMSLAFDPEKRKAQITRKPLPTYISSEETQRRRHEWTNLILNGIYNKTPQQTDSGGGGGGNVQS
jgi:hypothetical protein